ncbi:MAG: site-specific integrase [Planctomycetota bacterium]|nr:MAG: site-specific integrase [Planctomycetota bacterium]REK30368.1 MAG: site-specific integrase [Planctomycetota bacterium]REK40251.1 MAG: site-specific integrase [Planctomycetota bacterium]
MSKPDQFDVQVVKYADRKNLVLRYIDPYSGRQRTRSAGTTRQRDAERLAAQWEAELRSGQAAPRCNVSWEAFRDRYEAEVLPSLAENTRCLVGTVFNAIERIVRPKRLHDLSADRLSYFQSKLREEELAEASIQTYLAHLVSALRWAAKLQMIAAVPAVQRPTRAKKSKLMKGRPITLEEFERMLDSVAAVVSPAAVQSWQHLLRGLWWSGLRLGEALNLDWNRQDRLRVVYSGRRPMFAIPGELEKGNQDRLLPLAPEFAEYLEATPLSERSGPVFKLQARYGRPRTLTLQYVSRTICRIGKQAGIKVHTDVRTGRIKYASAHDLRRSFGERWARKVMPQVLKELMRHASIETTMKYYVGHNAELTADAVWEAYGSAEGKTSPTRSGETSTSS